MIRGFLLGAAAVLAATAAHADPRIRSVPYDPDAVVRVEGALSSAIQIVFAEGEEIRHVAMGDSAAWEAAPEGQLLFLKPLEARPTNLIVATRSAGGAARNYAFDLRVSKAAAPWMLRFSYPADDKAQLQNAIAAREDALRARLLQLKLDRGAVEGPRNLSWTLQGATALQPSEVSDNGRFTVLRFPGGQEMPAVFAVASDGAETLAPFDVRGEFLVVHGVYPQLRLRRGDQVVCLWNEAFDPRGGGAPAATASDDVRRTDVGIRP